MKFCDWLKVIRYHKLSLTQDQMADMLKVKVGTLRAWEQGRIEPPVYYQYLLNKYYMDLYVHWIEESKDKSDSLVFDI